MIDIIPHATRHVGAPYVWRGKGRSLWTPRSLVPHPWAGYVFDCSGLVTTAIKAAGGPDLRATHSAQTMFDQFPIADEFDGAGVLRFYGPSRLHVSHVAICLGRNERGQVLVVEAAGGDETTTTPLSAQQRGAKVRQGVELRRDFLGSRSVPT